jgi:micrococcal nuclease
MARSRAVVVAIVAAVLAGSSVGGWWLGHTHHGRSAAIVTRVLDGDTIRVRTATGAETVRILGVDTPETHHPAKPVECFGPEAAAHTRARLLGRSIELEGDTEPRDRYGRRLAYVVVDGERFGDELLRLGLARFLVIPPNEAHARALLEAELEAKQAGRGLWSAC